MSWPEAFPRKNIGETTPVAARKISRKVTRGRCGVRSKEWDGVAIFDPIVTRSVHHKRFVADTNSRKAITRDLRLCRARAEYVRLTNVAGAARLPIRTLCS